MFPFVAIAGAISAAASVIKGASWIADQLDSSRTTSAGSKVGVKPQTEAKASSFEAALAAQAAGQTLPGGSTSAEAAKNSTPYAWVQPTRGTDYDTLARMQAGLAAYGHIGERHGNDAGSARQSSADGRAPITRS
jgi:hypothetical protein